MSYCVQCGVELEKSLRKCPLCHTPVLNPNTPVDQTGMKPYPEQKGEVEMENKTVAAILLSVILSSTAIACGLLNLFIFKENLWSLYVIGACALFWIFSIPLFIYAKLSIYLTILFDGIATDLYIGIIAYFYPGNGWYFKIAVPIISFLTLGLIFFVFFTRKISRSFLSKCVVIFSEIGVLSVMIELLIRNYLKHHFFITWSAVVLTCCIIVIIMLMTIIRVSDFREEVRRRMHL
ncbi:MAG TPA: hypothetical protein IAC41_12435 [Candidatus Merdenecus merdavium]|nr:hypothetical protein [Candidatus Merdenecus merdavium]